MAQPRDVKLHGLHLPLAWKGLRRIGVEVFHSFAKDILVNIQVARRLRHRA